MPDHIRKILIEAKFVLSPSSALGFASDPDTYNLGIRIPHVPVTYRNTIGLTYCLCVERDEGADKEECTT